MVGFFRVSMEDIMSAGYVIARENFKEAGKHVSAESDPVMFNLLYGLQSLTNQIEADFASLLGGGMPNSFASLTKKPKTKARGKKSSPSKLRRKKARRA
jgi:hypothetical protein